jgi:hypothetical protein
MKAALILSILLLLIAGCSTVQNPTPEPSITTDNTISAITNTESDTTGKISGTQELILTDEELKQLAITSDSTEQDRQLYEMSDGSNCRTDKDYTNIVDTTSGEYSICLYNIPNLNNTQVVIELQKFANYEALNGSYQYSSLHLYSVQGLLSENDFGDQSRFRVNNVNDYGGEFNDPNIYFYHLWICKDLYLIHITSKGTSNEAKEYVARIGRLLLSKFE